MLPRIFVYELRDNSEQGPTLTGTYNSNYIFMTDGK